MFSFSRLILFIINLVRKTLQLELNKFTENIGCDDVSKQAFSKARKKLNPVIFKILNKTLIEEFYTDNEYKLFEGYRLLAIDGSKIQLPSSTEIIQAFGCTRNQCGDTLPMAMGSTVFDPLNKITIDAIIASIKTSEKDLALNLIENVFEINKQTNISIKDLFIFDRGYPSIQLLTQLTIKQKDFLMRCPINFITEIEDIIQKNKIDQIIELDIFNRSRRTSGRLINYFPNLNRKIKFKIRIINLTLPSGEKEILLTSLLDQKNFSPLKLFNLYDRRWDTEENYKFHKSIAQIENFSGKSKLSVEQDFYATVFTCNIANMLAQEALEEVNQALASKNLKYSYTINKNIALGTLKDELIYALLDKQNLNDFCEKIKNRMGMSLVPIRKNRSFPRYKSPKRKYATNKRGCL